MLPGGGSHPRESEDGGIPFFRAGRQGRRPIRATARLTWPAPVGRDSFVKNLTIFEVSGAGAYDSMGSDVLSSSDVE